MSQSLSSEDFGNADSSHAATAPFVDASAKGGNARAPKSIKRSSATVHAQIITALQRGLRSRAELCAEVDARPEVVKRFLDELRDLGAAYVAKRDRFVESQTCLTELFSLNAKPFENADAPRPPRSRHNFKE